MKQMKCIFTCLCLCLFVVSAYSQRSNELFKVQDQNYQMFFLTVVPEKKLEFTDKADYMYSGLIDPAVKDDGTWDLTVDVSSDLSIVSTLVGVVPATMTEDEIMSQYESGQLKGDKTSNKHYDTFHFNVQDGDWKVYFLGLDARGTARNLIFSDEVSLPGIYYQWLSRLFSMQGFGNIRTYGINWGYGSVMLTRDMMGEDYAVNNNSNYNHYNYWLTNQSLSNSSSYQHIVYHTLDSIIGYSNLIIDRMEKRKQVNNNVDEIIGASYAVRAMTYLDAARMYEFLDNDKTSHTNADGKNVTGLTFPIRTNLISGSNPTRATKSEMVQFILSDLNKAEQYLKGKQRPDKTIANLAVVYGLKARLYLWNEDYSNAQQFAEKVIQISDYSPLTKSEWTSPTEGFNTSKPASWIWSIDYSWCSDLNYNLRSWASFQSTELFSYAEMNGHQIGKSVYDGISDTDFRKLSFKAPGGSNIARNKEIQYSGDGSKLSVYSALKFRPGSGDNPLAVEAPLMRVEEMYFVKFECLAHQGNLSAANQQLSDFMRSYRDANYSFQGSTTKQIIDEIFKQKRIEFWGEGINYFDYKRLNKPVRRSYKKSNYYSACQFNTTTRPAWMNFVFPWDAPVGKWNNPDPSGVYKTVNN